MAQAPMPVGGYPVKTTSRSSGTQPLQLMQATATSVHHYLKVTGDFTDNTLYLLNDSETGASKGYAGMVAVHPSDEIGGRMLAVCMGPDVVNEYGNRAFIATNPSVSTNSPPDIGLWQEQDNGSGYISHRRLFLDGTNKAITLYGWSNSAASGAVGVHVNTAGAVGVGTSTLTTGAALTVNGAIHSTPQSWDVHKNNVDQTISAGAWTDVTFGTEVYDHGGIFASNQATPTIVSGIVSMNVLVTFTSPQNGERLLVGIAKNGTRIIEIEQDTNGANTAEAITFTFDDLSDGDDVYKVQVFRSAGTVVGGGIANTRFQGRVY